MASDIDFDELDRAVSSILGSNDDSTDNKSAADAAPVDATPVDAATTVTVSSTPPQQDTKPAQVIAPANRRSNGRFMDIRSTGKPAATSSVPTSPATPVPQPSFNNDVSPANNTPSSTDWPDPIDFMSNKNQPTTNELATPEASVDETTPAAVEAPVDDAPKPVNEPVDSPTVDDISDVDAGELTPTEPPITPFLPDAKVEKRPLGSFASPMVSGSNNDDLMDHRDEVKLEAPNDLSATPAVDGGSPVDAPADMSTDNLNVDQDAPSIPSVDSDTPMPAELQEDVLSLESDEVKTPSEPIVAAPTSIVQQYREKQPTETPTSGAIYDTEAYHKPLTPKKKSSKKHGWMIALWVFLLIILGAGAGAAIYYFVLPLLG